MFVLQVVAYVFMLVPNSAKRWTKMVFFCCCVSGNVSCDSSQFYRADRQTRVKILWQFLAILIIWLRLFRKSQQAYLCWVWLWQGGGLSWVFLLCCVSGNVSCDSSRFYRADRQTRVFTLLRLPVILMFWPWPFGKSQPAYLCWVWLAKGWTQLVFLA